MKIRMSHQFAADHVQGQLRRVPANRFAVPGEAHAALFHSTRMRNRDVEDLFARVAVGDVVELHGERDAELARIFAEGELSAGAMSAGGGQ
jgi:hypothetical protein